MQHCLLPTLSGVGAARGAVRDARDGEEGGMKEEVQDGSRLSALHWSRSSRSLAYFPFPQREAQCAHTSSTAFTTLDIIFAHCFLAQNNYKIDTCWT